MTLLLVLAVLAPTLAGCGDDGSASEPAPTTAGTQPATTGSSGTNPPPTSTTTTGPPTSEDEVAVRAVFDRYWPAFLDATMNPDPEHPVLQSVLTGEARTRILGAIAAMKRDGERVVQPPNSVFAHEIVSLEFTEVDRATVRECVVDDLQIVGANGAPIDDEVGTSEYTSHLVLLDGEWRISYREATNTVDGAHGCEVLE